MDIVLIIALIVWGLHFYLKYRDRQNDPHMRSGGSHFINSKTGKPFSKKGFDKKVKEGLEIFEEYLDEPLTTDMDENKEGNEDVKISYYDNGKKKLEGTNKGLLWDGLWTKWYENGQKKWEKNYKKAIEDGKWTFWYEHGQKYCEETWKDGKRDGVHTWWYKDGQKGREITFKDGKKDGLSTYWRNNGQKYKEATYKDGKYILSRMGN